jgi:predicted aspartyl protease
MDCDPFIVSALIDDTCFAETLVDTGCLSYGLCDPRFAQKNKLTRLRIDPRTISGVDGRVITEINEVAVVRLDLDGYRERRVFLYVAPTGHYDMILGLP